MLVKRFLLLFAAVVVVAGLAAVPAQAQFGAIEGDVKDKDGKPLTGAQIIIERTDIKGTYRVKSDRRGRYFHGGLPLGVYSVSLRQGDQVIDAVQNVRVRLGDPIVVNFDLQQLAERQMAAQAGIQVPAAPGPGQAPSLTAAQKAEIEKRMKEREQQRQRTEKLQNSFNLGMDLMKQNAFDEAIPQFEAAAEADPTQHVVFAQLGEAYANSARSKSGQDRTDRFAKSIEAYRKALELKPDDASYHNNFALALIASGNVEEGQANLQKAAQLDPTNAGQYYFNLGAVLTNSGRAKEATEAFRKATEVQPGYAIAWYQLGVSLLSEAKLDEKTGQMIPVPGTVEALQKYLDLQPSGQFSAEAKAMIETLGQTVQTEIKVQRPARKR
jgi:tetratricopeptide (TPR) repeat protein